MYLVDTNIWLERLLNQDKSDEVGQFLKQVSARDLSVTDFTFHSICVVLTRLGRSDVLLDFVEDVFAESAVNLVSIKPEQTPAVIDEGKKYKLDFDDAYQYVAIEENGWLISFDSDFDRTSNGKKAPAEVLREKSASDVESEAQT